MLIAENAYPIINMFWWMLMLVLFLGWLANMILVFFVIWSRKDWDDAWKIVATIVMVLSLLLLPIVGIYVYSIVDISTRKNLKGNEKALWIVGITFTFTIATFPYFIWALRHKPQARLQPQPRPLPSTVHQDPGTLNADDLDYLQRLADLHTQGVLTDEQYEKQRNHRLGTQDTPDSRY